MNRQIINGQQVELADVIKDFIVKQKPSSNVEYFGFNTESDVFVQFKNGSSYIYKKVSNEIIGKMITTESIGSFVAKNLVKGFEAIKHERRFVEPVIDEPANEQA